MVKHHLVTVGDAGSNPVGLTIWESVVTHGVVNARLPRPREAGSWPVAQWQGSTLLTCTGEGSTPSWPAVGEAKAVDALGCEPSF